MSRAARRRARIAMHAMFYLKRSRGELRGEEGEQKEQEKCGGGLGEGGELGERTGGRISINASSTYSVSTT